MRILLRLVSIAMFVGGAAVVLLAVADEAQWLTVPFNVHNDFTEAFITALIGILGIPTTSKKSWDHLKNYDLLETW